MRSLETFCGASGLCRISNSRAARYTLECDEAVERCGGWPSIMKRLFEASVIIATLIGAATRWLPSTVAAQQPTGQVFRSETELVTVAATVQDRRGRAITALTQADFTLTEDNQPQEIALFTQDAETPMSIVLLVDVSGSMIDKLDNVEDALRHFAAAARSDDEIALIEFSTYVDILVPFGAPRDPLTRAFTHLTARGGTALYDAVIEGLHHLARGGQRKKVLLLLTDGNDNSSRASRSDAVKAVTRSEALVYALGLGHGERGSFGHDVFALGEDTVDIRVLKALVEPAGGRAELIENPHRKGVDLIDQTIADFARELRQQYTLGYYPIRPWRDDEVRRIKVSTRNGEYVVRARTAYRRDTEPSAKP